MSDTFKFPNGGHDVIVCRKQDIIDCLDKNVVDKDVVLAVISQCELDASKFLAEGRWTGIPFLGSIRTTKYRQKINSPEIKELIKEARETLDAKRYYVFRQQLGKELSNEVKEERFYRYIVSGFVSKNRNFYNKQVSKQGEAFARFLCYTLTNITIGAPKEDF